MMKFDAAAKRRWSVLIIALMATLAAIAYPVEDEGLPAPRQRAAPIVGPQTEVARPLQAVSDDIEWMASDVDPFALRSWAPPPEALPAAAPLPSREVASVAAAPSGPPPLPYKFIGQMDTGTETMIYLGRDDQVHLAKVGDVLDGSYKIVQLTRTQIEFELLGSSERQTLAIPSQDIN